MSTADIPHDTPTTTLSTQLCGKCGSPMSNMHPSPPTIGAGRLSSHASSSSQEKTRRTSRMQTGGAAPPGTHLRAPHARSRPRAGEGQIFGRGRGRGNIVLLVWPAQSPSENLDQYPTPPAWPSSTIMQFGEPMTQTWNFLNRKNCSSVMRSFYDSFLHLKLGCWDSHAFGLEKKEGTLELDSSVFHRDMMICNRMTRTSLANVSTPLLSVEYGSHEEGLIKSAGGLGQAEQANNQRLVERND
ncbi:hypothetical protein B0T20DRAFT_465527 [Sordaria brevicollis]|uniref:Uncharacterized protein n=1 Tax=Sordaria brevicollis TaxID=83679 RepID=A0AAE0UGJ6_SORBR|nr:hypothetical protein B0T20DRAFT_465527 [Sordaria brevicollis]